jgi:hypothetical protein
MNDTRQPATTEMLLAMADQAFEKIIISQLNPNRRTPEIYELLLSPAVVQRTKEMLDVMRLRTQDTMQAKRSHLYDFQARCVEEGPTGKAKWLRGKSEFEASRKKSGHFLKLIEIMQVQVKRALRDAVTPPQTSPEVHLKRKERTELIKKLVHALIAHEEAQLDECTAEDEKLWDVLDNLTITWGDQECTLREAHESGWT